jgi:hypothetical protein
MHCAQYVQEDGKKLHAQDTRSKIVAQAATAVSTMISQHAGRTHSDAHTTSHTSFHSSCTRTHPFQFPHWKDMQRRNGAGWYARLRPARLLVLLRLCSYGDNYCKLCLPRRTQAHQPPLLPFHDPWLITLVMASCAAGSKWHDIENRQGTLQPSGCCGIDVLPAPQPRCFAAQVTRLWVCAIFITCYRGRRGCPTSANSVHTRGCRSTDL